MTIDLEGDLRREFDAATPPSSLTFHPESIVRQGNRTIRRHRIVAGGSAAMAVALVATGVGLLTRPHDTAAPQPATQTVTQPATSGIVRAEVGFTSSRTLQIELNRDARVTSNVKLVAVNGDGRRQELGTWSTTKPGQKPDATWKSGMVDGHPFTIGLVPGTRARVELATDPFSYGTEFADMKDTGYRAFSVDYDIRKGKQAARPAQMARISWSGPTGVVDGIEGNHRLTGRAFTLSKTLSVEVVLRPDKDGRTTVFGSASLGEDGHTGFDLGAATTDPSRVAVVAVRQPIARTVLRKASRMTTLSGGGPPLAAGVLPVGASNIGVILTTGEPANGPPVSERLPDGRVVFAVQAEGAQPSIPSKDTIEAVTWTNADGSRGRKDVTQHER